MSQTVFNTIHDYGIEYCKMTSMFLILTTDQQFSGEIYQDQSFMRKLHAQLAFLKVRAATIMAFLNYFQDQYHMLHKHIQRWRDYCTISRQIPAWKKIFCFVLSKVTISRALIRTDLPLQFSLHCCIFQIVEVFQEGAETVLKFLNQIQLLDPRNLNDVEGDFTSI